MCTAMTSDLSNDLEQFGHLRMRFWIRASTHPLQNRWPHVLSAVFLKLTLQMLQRASRCVNVSECYDDIACK